jgi:hypothetical protein
MWIVIVGFRAVVSGFPNMRLKRSLGLFWRGWQWFSTISPRRTDSEMTISQVTDATRCRLAFKVTMPGGPRTSIEGPSSPALLGHLESIGPFSAAVSSLLLRRGSSPTETL